MQLRNLTSSGNIAQINLSSRNYFRLVKLDKNYFQQKTKTVPKGVIKKKGTDLYFEKKMILKNKFI